ncbi:MAG: hypothetical protein M3362_17420 [Acidobacteriota bacterium]|nr:hypothetical protein [Acidobacteriota bacterium]
MPYTFDNGRLRVSGALGTWVQDITRWYEEDTNDNLRQMRPDLLHQYYYLVVVDFMKAAELKWNNEPGGGQKKAKLIQMIPPGAPNTLNIWGVLDYLAENLDDSFRSSRQAPARQFAKDFMKKHNYI